MNDDGRLRDEFYPEGYRHIEDHEVSIPGCVMCCPNSNLKNPPLLHPTAWVVIDAVKALFITGKQLRERWSHYTFAIKDTTKPIFNERILSKKTIESFLEGERLPVLDKDDQILLLAALAKSGFIEFEYY